MKLTFIPLNQNKSVFHINSLICEGQKGVMYISNLYANFCIWSFLYILPISNKSQKCEQNLTIFRGQAQFSDLLLSALTMISFSLPGRLKVIKVIFFSRTVFLTRIAAEYGSLCPIYEPPCLLLYRPISITSSRGGFFCLQDHSLTQLLFALYLIM